MFVPEHEKDDELSSLSFFTFGKNNTMTNNCTTHCHLSMLVPDHEDDDEKLRCSLSSLVAYSRI